MAIRQTIRFDKDVYLCTDHKVLEKAGNNRIYASRSMMLGFRYAIYYNGQYLMSVRDKYAPYNLQGKPAIEEFDISTWWFKTTMFNLDYIKSEMDEQFNNRFGEFLVWCEIIPSYNK